MPRTAICWRASSRRSPIGAPTNTAARSRTACASRSKCSAPCARPGRTRSRCRCASRRPTGWTAASPATMRSRSRALFAEAGCDLIDVSTGQTVADAQPVFGRMFQTPFSDQIRNEAGLATMCVGAITTADQVNTIVAAGRADLVALARPHLVDPYFTMRAAAWYGAPAIHCPPQYLAGKEQIFRNSAPRPRGAPGAAAQGQAEGPPRHLGGGGGVAAALVNSSSASCCGAPRSAGGQALSCAVPMRGRSQIDMWARPRASFEPRRHRATHLCPTYRRSRDRSTPCTKR